MGNIAYYAEIYFNLSEKEAVLNKEESQMLNRIKDWNAAWKIFDNFKEEIKFANEFILYQEIEAYNNLYLNSEQHKILTDKAYFLN